MAPIGIEAPNSNNNNILGQQDINNDSNFNIGNGLALADTMAGAIGMMLSDKPVYSVASGVVACVGIVRAGRQCFVSCNASRRRTQWGGILDWITDFICIIALIVGIVLDVYAYMIKK